MRFGTVDYRGCGAVAVAEATPHGVRNDISDCPIQELPKFKSNGTYKVLGRY